MKTMKFRTSAKCGGCVAKIGEQLAPIATPEQWSIDLSSPDKTLTISTDASADDVVRAVQQAGFRAEPLP